MKKILTFCLVLANNSAKIKYSSEYLVFFINEYLHTIESISIFPNIYIYMYMLPSYIYSRFMEKMFLKTLLHPVSGV